MSRSSDVISALLALFLVGCSSPLKRSGELATPDAMVVEIYQFKQSEPGITTLHETDPEVMKRVRQWLAKVTPRQPPRNELGEVRPKVTISFHHFMDSKRKSITETFEVYRFSGWTSADELLKESEVEELWRIVEKK